MIAVREYASAEELQRHAREVRERLLRPRPRLVEIPKAAWRPPVVSEHLKPALNTAYTVEDCLRIVVEVTGVSAAKIFGPVRAPWIAKPRQIVCWLAFKYTAAPKPEIGRYLARDHSTIKHAITKIDRVIEHHKLIVGHNPGSDASRLWLLDWPKS